MSEWKRPPHEMAEASRRAAAIWTHWDRSDFDGVVAVVDEMNDNRDWLNLVCGLLNLGDNMIEAARAGQDRDHLACVLAAASVDESTSEADCA